MGNIVSQDLGGDAWSYEYDDLNQIASAILRDSGQSTIFSHNYNYDATGNRTNLTNDATKQYTYDGENRMTSENGTDYTYDNNGNLVSKSTGGLTSETFEYDALNRLTKYTAYDGSTTTYKYDPFGRRTEKSSPSGIRKYLWDGIKIVCEYDDADTLTDKLTYGINREILSRRATITVGTTPVTADYYYHHDHLGSVVMLTDSTGTIVNAYNYDDFGNIISSSETIPNDYAYTGKQLDRESGLYYYGARYYDGKTGRFTGKDLLPGRNRKPTTKNRYIYTVNNPLAFVDIWGLDTDNLISGGVDEKFVEWMQFGDKIEEAEREMDLLEEKGLEEQAELDNWEDWAKEYEEAHPEKF